jgi:pimeloyl-ACP methyl ester carboxylesterase
MDRKIRSGLLWGLMALLLGAPTIAGALDGELRTLPTRPGVTQPFWLIRPEGRPAAVFILFAGDRGRLALSAEGIGWEQNNFLIRNRSRFVKEGFAVALVDVPSDRTTDGLTNFRLTAAHAEDVRLLLAALRKEFEAPLWLVGTSMGTVSAASAAGRLKEGGPDGIVLTATVTRESRQVRETVKGARLTDIRVPALVVHHRKDGCAVSPYSGAVSLVKDLTGSSRTELLTFEGGDPPQSDPCEAMSPHGFLGIDGEVVEAISRWIKPAR